MDLLMGGNVAHWDGLQATQMIRLFENSNRNTNASNQNSAMNRVVIVGTSASVSLKEDTRKTLAAGMDAFFQKPFTDGDVWNTKVVDWTTSTTDDASLGYGTRDSNITIDLFKKEVELADFVLYASNIAEFVMRVLQLLSIVDLHDV